MGLFFIDNIFLKGYNYDRNNLEGDSMSIITIKNNKLTVEISTLGAEIQSVKCGGKEYFWEGDPAVWSGRAPVLFPICGGLKDDKYELNGKEYTLQKHGFARKMEFVAESVESDKAVFLLTANEETKIGFPFDFEFRITYTLVDKSIKVGYDVKNLSNEDMYFSVGGHEAYACPEGIEEYYLKFEEKETLTHNELHGVLLSNESVVIAENTDELPLKYSYFDIDALTMLNLKSRKVSLCHKVTGKKITVDFNGFDYLFVWTKPGANAGYLCIEPWCGIPDFEGTSYDIKEKKGINKLSSQGTFNRVHTITIEE